MDKSMKFKKMKLLFILVSLMTMSQITHALSLETSVEIDVPPERVWHILTDFSNHSNWDPFIREITGELREGATLSITIQPTPDEKMHFSPIITRLESSKELRWISNLWGIDFLFSGEHYFKLKRNKDNTTTLVHGEKFTGILLFMFSSQFEQNTLSGFKSFNKALKVVSEAQIDKMQVH